MTVPTYAELYDLAFIKGSWVCPKCGFILQKSTINASNGDIGTSEVDRQSEPCPNDGEWLEPATYKRTASELQQRLLQEFNERDAAYLLIVDLYYSAHREGWQPGESVDEVCERAHNYLCNRGLDPYTNGGPAVIDEIRKRLGDAPELLAAERKVETASPHQPGGNDSAVSRVEEG